jgi:hypothetical protein
MTKGGESNSKGSNDFVFGDSCQRGREYLPKAKGPHHHLILKVFFQLVWFFNLVSSCVQKGGENSIFKINILKPSWTLRGGFHLGGVLFSQRKSIWKQGEKISNLENASQTLIPLPLTICKRTLKRIYKRICKNKTCGASVVQNVKNEETIHAYIISIYIGSIPSNLCTYIMQASSIMHFYICFGLCWHQSPKRGRLKWN